MPEQLTFREKLNRLVMFVAFGCSGFAVSLLACGITLGADPIVWYAMLPTNLLSGFAIFLTLTKKNSRIGSWFVVVIGVIVFPLLFMTSGGTLSGVPIWIVMGLVYMFILFDGRALALVMSLIILSLLGIYVVTYYHPDLVAAGTRLYTYSDSFVAVVLVSCFIGLFIKLQARSYERERQLAEHRRQEVEQLARSKDIFFANMSHEIRTPLNTIIGLNEMILREENISDEVAENAINIQNASKMLLTVINDILDLSKLESGKMEIVPTQYEISSMFSDLVNLIWIRAHQKNLEFKVDIDPEIPSMLYGDEIRIKQVVANLLSNAVKYTETGSVTLTAKSERIDANRILLRISVEDTGKGIRKESLDNLFDLFKRVDEPGTRYIEGTGLGLSISKQLIEMMDGKITVDSIYHKGSIFTVELKQQIINMEPVGSIDFAARRQLNRRTHYRQTFNAPDARVLVVDDNSMNLMVAVKLLRGTKIQIDTAGSGKEALEKTAKKAYHLILMDHMMAEMDGEAALKAVRSQPKGFCQRTPVIALTANIMPNAEQVYQKMGFDGYLTKPINSSLLEASLLKYLPHELVEYTVKEEETASPYEGPHQVRSTKKRRIAITADCICDLPEELLTQFKIRLMYLYIHTGAGRFCDLSEISSDGLLAYLETEGNQAYSSAAEPFEYEYFFAESLAEAEHVIHITATTDLSQTYANAVQAAASFDNVTVLNSDHISSGYGLVVLYAAMLAEGGKNVSDICGAVECYKKRVFSNFIVPGTATLYRCGKISGAVHKLCTLLGLHPVLAMSQNRLKIWHIETGNMRRMIRQYVKRLFKYSAQIDPRVLFLTYAGCSAAQIDEILAVVEQYIRFDRVIVQKASATVSCNCGIGSFGLIFVQKGRRTEDETFRIRDAGV